MEYPVCTINTSTHCTYCAQESETGIHKCTQILPQKNCKSTLALFDQESKAYQLLSFFFFFKGTLSLVGNSAHLPWVRLQQPHEQRYPYLTVHAVFSCVQSYGCRCLGSLTWAQMLMPVIALGGCADTVRESAPKVDCGIKMPCCTGELTLPQWCANLMLYQLSYITKQHIRPLGGFDPTSHCL